MVVELVYFGLELAFMVLFLLFLRHLNHEGMRESILLYIIEQCESWERVIALKGHSTNFLCQAQFACHVAEYTSWESSCVMCSVVKKGSFLKSAKITLRWWRLSQSGLGEYKFIMDCLCDELGSLSLKAVGNRQKGQIWWKDTWSVWWKM